MSESRRQLSKFTAIFAGGTMISRVSGLGRDMVMTALIPTEPLAAFNVAFRLANMLRDLVGEGASNAAFVPVLSGILEKESKDAFREAVSAMMSAMIVLLGVVSALGVIFMPFVFQLLDPVGRVSGAQEMTGEAVALRISLTRWTFPYLFLIGLTVFQMGPLFIMKRYSIPSWSPALLNIAQMLICFYVWLSPHTFSNEAYALVLGAWIGGIAQLLIQFWAVGKYVGVWRPNFHLRHPAIRTAFWLLVPVLIGQSAGEINKMVDLLFANSFGKAAFNALFYANRLVQLPLSMFGIAISVAILPSISRAAARADYEEVRGTLIHGFRQCLFLTVPAVAALLIVPQPIIALLYQRGHYTAEHTAMTAAALAYSAIGLIAFAWVKVAVAGFYAVQNTKTPVTIAFVSMALNIGFIFLLARPMGFTGLALATTISYSLNFVLLYAMLCRRFGRLWDANFISSVIRIGIAGVACGFAMHFTRGIVTGYLQGNGTLQRLVIVSVILAVGGIVYTGTAAILRVSDVASFLSAMRRSRGSSN